MQLSYGLITAEQAKRLTLVPFDLEEPSTYKKALAGVGKVVCAVSQRVRVERREAKAGGLSQGRCGGVGTAAPTRRRWRVWGRWCAR